MASLAGCNRDSRLLRMVGHSARFSSGGFNAPPPASCISARATTMLILNGGLDTAQRQAGIPSDVATAASASIADLERRLNALSR